MNKTMILFILIIGIFLLSGCGSEALSEDDIDAWSEYLSYRILLNEDNYEWNLITEEPEPTAASPQDNDEVNDAKNENDEKHEEDNTSVEDVREIIGNAKYNEQFTNLLGYKGLTIEYDSYEILDEVTDGFLTIKADEGHEYYSVWFRLKNNSDENIAINLTDNKIAYQLHINLSSVYKARLNMLRNDIRFLDTEIKAGDTYNACALFLLPRNTLIDKLEIIIKIDEQSLIYELK